MRTNGNRLIALAMLAAVAGCASLPEVPDGPADPLPRHLAQQRALDGAPPSAGNRIAFLSNGEEALPAMFRAIAEARDHVNLEFYILQDVRAPGMEGTSLFALLAAKLRQGVQVSLIHDGIGSLDTPDAAFEALRRLGARTLAYHPVDPLQARRGWRPNNRDHRKILVVDGRVAFTGGINMDRVYENPCGAQAAGYAVDEDHARACWHDTAVRIEGPAVAELQRMFLGNWAAQGGPPLPARDWFPALPPAGDAEVRIVGSDPSERRPLFYRTLVTALDGARERIWLSTGFFVPTHRQRKALVRAARRGVDVRLVLPSFTDSPMALAAGHAAYDDLLSAGVRIFEVRDAVLHSKMAVVDGVWTGIGSSNFDHRSVALNAEVDCIILGRRAASEAEAKLSAEMRKAPAITLDEWRQRPLGARLHESYARLWVDLL